MKKKIKDIITRSATAGWIVEPLAKEIIRSYGLPVSNFFWAKKLEDALQGAKKIGYPLVAKVVSEKIIHKSDVGGVIVGVRDNKQLAEIFGSFSELDGFAGILLDEMLGGVEVILGSKNDVQFGTVIMVGIGGTSVEIYKDVALRLAPVSPFNALQALNALKGIKLLQGYRGGKQVDMEKLASVVADFSKMAYDLKEEIQSIDLNPVLCMENKIVVADARFVLQNERIPPAMAD